MKTKKQPNKNTIEICILKILYIKLYDWFTQLRQTYRDWPSTHGNECNTFTLQ